MLKWRPKNSNINKIIVDEISYEGVINLGHNVQLGYFAQNQSTYLDGTKTVLESAEDSATPENRTKVRETNQLLAKALEKLTREARGEVQKYAKERKIRQNMQRYEK